MKRNTFGRRPSHFTTFATFGIRVDALGCDCGRGRAALVDIKDLCFPARRGHPSADNNHGMNNNRNPAGFHLLRPAGAPSRVINEQDVRLLHTHTPRTLNNMRTLPRYLNNTS